MGKQEEIRGELGGRLGSLLMLWGEPPQEAKETAKELIGAWFQYLDREGVVLKVERELPEIQDVGLKVREWVRKLYEYYQTGVVQIEEYKQLVSASHILQIDTEIHLQRFAQEEMLKAGYTAVEPLIEEVE